MVEYLVRMLEAPRASHVYRSATLHRPLTSTGSRPRALALLQPCLVCCSWQGGQWLASHFTAGAVPSAEATPLRLRLAEHR